MKDKSKLLIPIYLKIVCAAILCCMITILANSFVPHLTNEVAIGQLQNDDVSWSLLQTWYVFQDVSSIIKLVICAVCGLSIGSDIYKYLKQKEKTKK